MVIEFSASRRAAEASDRGDDVPTTVSVFLSDWDVDNGLIRQLERAYEVHRQHRTLC